MGRPVGSKDKYPRWRKPKLKVVKTPFQEGIYHIVEKAINKGMEVDLWEMLNCFRRIKNL